MTVSPSARVVQRPLLIVCMVPEACRPVQERGSRRTRAVGGGSHLRTVAPPRRDT